LFDWLKRTLWGAGIGTPVRRFEGPGICPYCGEGLRTTESRQCFICGADWHNPFQPVFRRASREDAAGERLVRTVAVAAPERSGGPPKPTPPPPRKVALAGLDASKFKPISRAKMMLSAGVRQVGFMWGNPWFGRRDLIPPTSDSRTLLIDRAMVTQGLITPEELAQIHQVGDEMDEIRPAIAYAEHAARQAADKLSDDAKAERAARKKRKKEEAAERRRLHAEAVAHRRKTDVVFLGRGVSRGLADRRANVEKLEAAGLPVLATPADVAEALDISISRLRWLAFHNEAATRTHYVRFTVPKRSGGVRELAAPHRDLRAAQQWIFWSILSKVPVHEAAHGFVRGRSTVSNAAEHTRADVLLNTDLVDFFPSITFPRVMGVFCELGYSPAAATILALLCTEAPRRTVDYDGTTYHVATGPRALPQGACTSPTLSNLVARRLDARLAGLADKLHWRYTRYADDATFSTRGPSARKLAYLLARIRHITDDEGFAVNEKKTRIVRPNAAQTVTGVVVNRRPNAPRKLVRRLRAILHHARHEGLEAQNREKHPNFECWLDGMISYVTMVNPRQGQPLRKALREIQGSA